MIYSQHFDESYQGISAIKASDGKENGTRKVFVNRLNEDITELSGFFSEFSGSKINILKEKFKVFEVSYSSTSMFL